MTALKKAIVKSYDAAAHKATVQIAGSLGVWLEGIRVATNIPTTDVVAGRQCSVLFLDPSNQDDAVVIAIQGAVPSGGGGTSDHDLLNNLAYADAGHTGFVASGGVAGGQTIKGGTAASEVLTLESTAHATKGYIAAKDPIRMTSTTAANTRIADSITGTLSYLEIGWLSALKLFSAFGLEINSAATFGSTARVDGTIAVQSAPDSKRLIRAAPALGNQSGAWYACDLGVSLTAAANGTTLTGLLAQNMSISPGSYTGVGVWGLRFVLAVGSGTSASTVTTCKNIYAKLAVAAYDGIIPTAHGLHIDAIQTTLPGANQSIGQYYGALLSAPNYNKVVDYTGLAIPDETAASGNIRLLEIGPATPYLRVVGGAGPGADLSNVWADFGGIGLRQIQVGAANSAGAGFRVMRIAN